MKERSRLGPSILPPSQRFAKPSWPCIRARLESCRTGSQVNRAFRPCEGAKTTQIVINEFTIQPAGFREGLR
jgi:hypothetical protein